MSRRDKRDEEEDSCVPCLEVLNATPTRTLFFLLLVLGVCLYTIQAAHKTYLWSASWDTVQNLKLGDGPPWVRLVEAGKTTLMCYYGKPFDSDTMNADVEKRRSDAALDVAAYTVWWRYPDSMNRPICAPYNPAADRCFAGFIIMLLSAFYWFFLGGLWLRVYCKSMRNVDGRVPMRTR